ncbi:MAG: hypothetical protein ABMA26_21710 [Limisphaerales bacterium]
MNQSPSTSLLDSNSLATARWSSEQAATRTVRPANRIELRGALEANEVFLAFMEILPDYSHCGINE